MAIGKARFTGVCNNSRLAAQQSSLCAPAHRLRGACEHTTAMPAPTVVDSPANVDRPNARNSVLLRSPACCAAKPMVISAVVAPTVLSTATVGSFRGASTG